MHPNQKITHLGPSPVGIPTLVKSSPLRFQDQPYQAANQAPWIPKNTGSLPAFQPPNVNEQLAPGRAYHFPQSSQRSTFSQDIHGSQYRADNTRSVPVFAAPSQSRSRIASYRSTTGTGDFSDIVPRRPQVFPAERAQQMLAQQMLATTRQHIKSMESSHHKRYHDDASLIDPRLIKPVIVKPSPRKLPVRPGKATNRHTPALISPNYGEREQITVGDVLGQSPTQSDGRTSQKRKLQNTIQGPARATTKNLLQVRENPTNTQPTLEANGLPEATTPDINGPDTRTKDECQTSKARLTGLDTSQPVDQARGGRNMRAMQELVLKSLCEIVEDDKDVWDLLESWVGGI